MMDNNCNHDVLYPAHPHPKHPPHPKQPMPDEWTTSRWEDEIVAVRARMARRHFTTPPVVFYGSSSFRLWTHMVEDLERLDVLNLGFGGATVESALRYFDKMMADVSARAMILYFGENDIAHDGLTAEQVYTSMKQLGQRIREEFGNIPLYFSSLKPSPNRWFYRDEFERLGNLLQQMSEKEEHVGFIDLSSCLIGANGRPVGRYFGSDQLHLNFAGYQIWSEKLKNIPALWQ